MDISHSQPTPNPHSSLDGNEHEHEHEHELNAHEVGLSITSQSSSSTSPSSTSTLISLDDEEEQETLTSSSLQSSLIAKPSSSSSAQRERLGTPLTSSSDSDSPDSFSFSPYSDMDNDKNIYHDTNQRVLGMAFYSFLGITILQTIFAIHAHSTALIADSIAMFVDAFTFLGNQLAEHVKFQNDAKCCCSDTMTTTSTRSTHMSESESQNFISSQNENEQQQMRLQEQFRLELQLQNLYLELIPPGFSVLVLLYVTYATTVDAMTTLLQIETDQGADGGDRINVDNNNDDDNDDDEPDMKVMMIFAFLALLVDIFNLNSFAGANGTIAHGHGTAADDINKNRNRTGIEDGNHVDPNYTTATHTKHCTNHISATTTTTTITTKTIMATEESPLLEALLQPSSNSNSNNSGTNSNAQNYHVDDEESAYVCEYEGESKSNCQKNRACNNDNENDDDHSNDNDDDDKGGMIENLNMCSAWTHVMADTMRSSAMLIAGSFSYATHGVWISPELADAVAALIVSLAIFGSCIPLIRGLYCTHCDILILRKKKKEIN